MTFIKNNREMVVLTLVVVGMFAGVCFVAYTIRGGQPWLY